jgi:Phage integrase, N-terminal SAM-like domain
MTELAALRVPTDSTLRSAGRIRTLEKKHMKNGRMDHWKDRDSYTSDGQDLWGQIARWTAMLANDQGLDPKTVARYGRAARRFATWLHARRRGAAAANPTDLASVTVEDAHAYRAALLADGQAPGTINRTLTALRLYFDRRVSGSPPAAEAEHDAPETSAPNPFRAIPLVPRR